MQVCEEELLSTIGEWFSTRRRPQPNKKNGDERLDIPGDLWVKCFQCNEVIFHKDLEANLKVCPRCHYHFRLSARERISITADEGTFFEQDADIQSTDFLKFVDSQPYGERLTKTMESSGAKDAVVIGEARINSIKSMVGVMDFGFMGGSMGSVVGEKVTRLFEQGTRKEIPVVLFSASGGARMQEGIMSLMQMAKTSAAIARFKDVRRPFISVLTDPTTGGTTASFAMLGDVHLAEPGALIGFAGPRVIEQTIRQKLPEGFQRAEYLEEHGMIDQVVHRLELKKRLGQLLEYLHP